MKIFDVFWPYILYIDLGRGTPSQMKVATQGDHHIRDQGVERYQRLCNIQGIRLKTLLVIFHVKSLR